MKTKIKLPKLLTIAWCKKNKKIVREMNEKYDKKYPSYWRRPTDADYWITKYQSHKIRAEKLNRQPAWADEQAIQKVFRDAPDGVEIDHQIPLCGEEVSGLHVSNNLAYLTQKENCQKSNKFTPRYFITNRATISLD
jgi:hypothetical protein